SVTCNFGDVLDGAVLTVSVEARLNQAGANTNTVTASAYGADENPADNTVKLVTTVNPAADLAVLLASSADPVTVSNNFTYTVTATNRGPSVATAVLLTNTLPAGVVFVSVSAGQGSCSQNSGV